MRTFARVSLVFGLVALAAGPLCAASLTLSAGPSIGAVLPPSPASPLGLVVGALAAGAVVGITIRKDAGTISAKFVQRAQAAQGDYKDGVAAAGGKWETGVAGAESSWEQGINNAVAQKRYTSGSSGKGTKYQANAVNLGSQRYGPGVANAKDAYARGIAPVLQVLSSLSLPPKSFRGSPSNQARANAVATALAALRTGH